MAEYLAAEAVRNTLLARIGHCPEHQDKPREYSLSGSLPRDKKAYLGGVWGYRLRLRNQHHGKLQRRWEL
jgi:hypothetical protein